MNPLWKWQAKKAWKSRLAESTKRPSKPFLQGKGAKVLLLVNQDDSGAVKAAQAFAKTYSGKGATVQTLAFTSTKIPKEEQSDTLWSKADLLYGVLPKPERELFWRKQAFDLVVHCALSPFEAFDYLVAGLNAHRRIAAYATTMECFDLIVSPGAGEGVSEYLRQVERYLEILSPTYA